VIPEPTALNVPLVVAEEPEVKTPVVKLTVHKIPVNGTPPGNLVTAVNVEGAPAEDTPAAPPESVPPTKLKSILSAQSALGANSRAKATIKTTRFKDVNCLPKHFGLQRLNSQTQSHKAERNYPTKNKLNLSY
jgi:hypothetical protein